MSTATIVARKICPKCHQLVRFLDGRPEPHHPRPPKGTLVIGQPRPWCDGSNLKVERGGIG